MSGPATVVTPLLSPDDWLRLLKKLERFANSELHQHRWRGLPGGVLPDGFDAPSLASQVIAEHFTALNHADQKNRAPAWRKTISRLRIIIEGTRALTLGGPTADKHMNRQTSQKIAEKPCILRPPSPPARPLRQDTIENRKSSFVNIGRLKPSIANYNQVTPSISSKEFFPRYHLLTPKPFLWLCRGPSSSIVYRRSRLVCIRTLPAEASRRRVRIATHPGVPSSIVYRRSAIAGAGVR